MKKFRQRKMQKKYSDQSLIHTEIYQGDWRQERERD